MICSVVLLPGLAAHVAPKSPATGNAVQGIVAAFNRHPVVLIGECHWLRQAGNFYIDLVRDPEFQAKVQDIVIEFASRNNQSLLDRYIAGEDVPIKDVRRIWRDTTKVASWESPIYAQWLAAIREVNRGLPPARRLRVLAGDTPIDWSRISSHAQWAALGNNNVSFAEVISEEILQKKRHALVVLGANHVIRAERGNTTERVEARYPGSTYVALMLCSDSMARATQPLLASSRAVPALIPLAGTSVPGNGGERPLSREADALLYLGPPQSLTMAMPLAGSLDAAYMKEVDRRSLIEWGELRARKFLGAAAR